MLELSGSEHKTQLKDVFRSIRVVRIKIPSKNYCIDRRNLEKIAEKNKDKKLIVKENITLCFPPLLIFRIEKREKRRTKKSKKEIRLGYLFFFSAFKLDESLWYHSIDYIFGGV